MGSSYLAKRWRAVWNLSWISRKLCVVSFFSFSFPLEICVIAYYDRVSRSVQFDDVMKSMNCMLIVLYILSFAIFSAFKLEIHGFAHCSWSETKTTGTGKDRKTRTVTYTGNEDYLATKTFLAGADDGTDVTSCKSGYMKFRLFDFTRSTV
jgi:hypothetical protein